MDGATSQLLLMGGMIAIVYFFMIRPQAKRNKEQQNFVNAIEKGNFVVTTSGIHGKVMEVDEKTVILQIDKNKGINIKVQKEAVSKELTATLETE